MKTLSVSLLIAFFSLSLFAQKPIELRLKPEKNKVYRLKSVSTQNIQINNGQITTMVKSNSSISFKAMEVTPDFVMAEIRFDTIISNVQAPGMTLDISSNNPGSLSSDNIGDIMSVFMNRLSKNPVYVKLSPIGTVMEIVNQKMLSDIVLQNLDSLKSPMGSMIKPRIKSMVDVKTIRAMIEPFTAILPGKAVAAGDTWTVNLTVDSEGMGFLYKNSFKLNGISNNVANVSCDSWVEPLGTGPVNMNGASVSYDVKGPGKSTMSIDINSGLLTNSSSTQTLQGNINANGTQMPAQIDATTQVSGI